MTVEPINMDPTALQLKDFEVMLDKCQQAAKDGDLSEYRALDHQLRNMAMAMIGGMPGLYPADDRYFNALKEAVVRLGHTAAEIDRDRRKLKTRKQTDKKIRLAYSNNGGRF